MPQIILGDDIKFQNGLVIPYQSVSSTPYSITTSSGPNSGHEYAMGVDTSSSAITINLPTDNPATTGAAKVVGRMYYIFDTSSNAATNNITVAAGGSGTIEGSSTLTISGNGDSVTLLCTAATSGAGTWKVV